MITITDIEEAKKELLLADSNTVYVVTSRADNKYWYSAFVYQFDNLVTVSGELGAFYRDTLAFTGEIDYRLNRFEFVHMTRVM